MLSLLCACRPDASAPASGEPAARLVSLAPSITEILFAIHAEDRLVGVTRFCTYPPEAQSRPEIGGLLDPNYEALLGLHPDLVILLATNAGVKDRLDALGLRVLEVNHQSLDAMLDSLEPIGIAAGAPAAARALHQRLDAAIAEVAARTAGRPRPKVLVSVGRTVVGGVLQQACIAGRDGYYDRILELAGADNAYSGPPVMFPVISVEGLLRLSPDLIIDLAPEVGHGQRSEAEIEAEWATVPQLHAVQEGRLQVIGDDYAVIPGPRVIQFLQRVAQLCHPEIIEH